MTTAKPTAARANASKNTANNKKNVDFADLFENRSQEMQKKVQENFSKTVEGLEKISNYQQHCLQAMLHSANVMGQAALEIAKENVEYSKSLTGDLQNWGEDLRKVKSSREFAESGNRIARDYLESFVGLQQRLSSLAVSSAKEAYRPINEQYEELFDYAMSNVR